MAAAQRLRATRHDARPRPSRAESEGAAASGRNSSSKSGGESVRRLRGGRERGGASGSASAAGSTSSAAPPADSHAPWISMLIPPDRIGLEWRVDMARIARGQRVGSRSASAAGSTAGSAATVASGGLASAGSAATALARKKVDHPRLARPRKGRPPSRAAGPTREVMETLYDDLEGASTFADSARSVLSSGRVTDITTGRSHMSWASDRSSLKSTRDLERLKDAYALATKRRLEAERRVKQLNEQLETVFWHAGNTRVANPGYNVEEMTEGERHELLMERTMNHKVALEYNRRAILARDERSKGTGL